MPQQKDSKTALFADVTMFYAFGPTTVSSVKRLQQQIYIVSVWFKEDNDKSIENNSTSGK